MFGRSVCWCFGLLLATACGGPQSPVPGGTLPPVPSSPGAIPGDQPTNAFEGGQPQNTAYTQGGKPESAGLIAETLNALTASAPHKRLDAVSDLVELDPAAALPAVADLVYDGDANIRLEAMTTLEAFDNPEALPLLIELQHHWDPQISDFAVDLLAERSEAAL